MQPLRGALALALALGALVWTLQTGRSMLAPVGVALAAWLVLGASPRSPAGSASARPAARDAAPRLRTCRAPTGARRWPTPGSA